jgi:hypothetical protein
MSVMHSIGKMSECLVACMDETNRSEKFERITRKLRADATLLRTWRLSGGLSARMTGVEIALADGSINKLIVREPGDWALRVDPGRAAEEFRVRATSYSRLPNRAVSQSMTATSLFPRHNMLPGQKSPWMSTGSSPDGG